MALTLHLRIEGHRPRKLLNFCFGPSDQPMPLYNINHMVNRSPNLPYKGDTKARREIFFWYSLWVCASVLCFSTASNASDLGGCFKAASDRYGVPEWLLWSVAKVESDYNPRAYNVNTNGSADIGLMQINTGWLPTLRKYGIEREHLWDACTSIQIGAWVLAQNVRAHGWNWKAIGAYNAKSEGKRNKYAWKIYRAANHVPRTASAR